MALAASPDNIAWLSDAPPSAGGSITSDLDRVPFFLTAFMAMGVKEIEAALNMGERALAMVEEHHRIDTNCFPGYRL